MVSVGPAVQTDLGQLVANLHKAKQDIPGVSQQLLVKTGEEIAERMRYYVPVKTGRLRQSIRVITEPGRVVVGPVGVDYALYVEYGTGSRGEFATLKQKNNVTMMKVQGKWVPLKRQTGQRAQPYMRPAAEDVLAPMGAKWSEAGARLIRGQDVA